MTLVNSAKIDETPQRRGMVFTTVWKDKSSAAT